MNILIGDYSNFRIEYSDSYIGEDGEHYISSWIYSDENIINISADTIKNVTVPFVTITGKTTDANGVAVANVLIEVMDMWSVDNIRYHVNHQVRSDANGNYSMTVFQGLNRINLRPPADSGFTGTGLSGLDIQTNINQTIILPLPDITSPTIISSPLVTMITDSTATVTWQTDEPSTSTVSYGEADSPSSSFSVAGYSRDHNLLLTGLSSSTLHSVKVSSTDETGNGPTESEVVTFTTLATPDTTPPVIIKGPILSSITHSSAVVEWTTDEATTTQLNYGLGNNTGTVISDTGLVTHHRVSIASLDGNSTYSLQVSSSDSEANGPTTSPTVTFTTLETPDTVAPVIISGPLVTDITEYSATIIWETDEPSTSGVSYNDGTAYGLIRDEETLVTYHEVRLTNLSAATLYNFAVSSADGLTNGPTLSTEETFTTLSEVDSEGPVITDDIKIIGITHQSAVLHWETDEPSNALIKYGTVSTDLNLQAADSTLKQKHNFQLTALEEDTTYYLSIHSSDALGNTEASEIVSFTTNDIPDNSAPSFTSIPTVLKATNKTVTIGWETDEPTEYQILYGIGTNRNLQKANGAKKTKHQVNITNLEANESYGYRVIITDSAGNQHSFDSN